MKKFLLIVSALCVLSKGAFALEHFIRFQGRLTDHQGRPIAGDPQVSFDLYDSPVGGNRVWGPSAFRAVQANGAGLFASDVGPFHSPELFSAAHLLFLQVTIKGGTDQTNQVMSPRQRLAPVPSALHAERAALADEARTVSARAISTEQIQDQSISSEKIIPHAIQAVHLSTSITGQLAPTGMIAMFARSCPEGWSRFDLLDNRFPMGTETYVGESRGNWFINGIKIDSAGDHSHLTNPHSHSAGSLTANPLTIREAYDSVNGTWPVKDEGSIHGQTSDSLVVVQSSGSHAHSFSSDGTWRPPYHAVVFCEKN